MAEAYQKSSSLEGVNFEPYMIRPKDYELMVYPSEWIFEGLIADSKIRPLSKYFYNRFWGRSRILCFQTLYYLKGLSSYFEGGVDHVDGVGKILTSINPIHKIFYSDSLDELRNGKLKSIKTREPIEIDDYIAVPLIPVSVECAKVYSIKPGKLMEEAEAIQLLERIKAT